MITAIRIGAIVVEIILVAILGLIVKRIIRDLREMK